MTKNQSDMAALAAVINSIGGRDGAICFVVGYKDMDGKDYRREHMLTPRPLDHEIITYMQSEYAKGGFQNESIVELLNGYSDEDLTEIDQNEVLNNCRFIYCNSEDMPEIASREFVVFFKNLVRKATVDMRFHITFPKHLMPSDDELVKTAKEMFAPDEGAELITFVELLNGCSLERAGENPEYKQYTRNIYTAEKHWT